MRYFTLLGLFAAASTQPNNSSYLRRHFSPPPPPRLVTPMYDFVEVLLALEKGEYAHVAVIYPFAAEFFRRAHELGHRPVVVSPCRSDRKVSLVPVRTRPKRTTESRESSLKPCFSARSHSIRSAWAMMRY